MTLSWVNLFDEQRNTQSRRSNACYIDTTTRAQSAPLTLPWDRASSSSFQAIEIAWTLSPRWGRFHSSSSQAKGVGLSCWSSRYATLYARAAAPPKNAAICAAVAPFIFSAFRTIVTHFPYLFNVVLKTRFWHQLMLFFTLLESMIALFSYSGTSMCHKSIEKDRAIICWGLVSNRESWPLKAVSTSQNRPKQGFKQWKII